MKVLKVYFCGFVAVFLAVLTLCFSHNCYVYADGKVGVETSEDFLLAIEQKASTINVGDIDFDGVVITIDYSVEIKSKTSKNAELKNVYFTILGSTSNDSVVGVKFSNISFVGSVSSTDYELQTKKSFEEFEFSNATPCISANIGCYNITLSNCNISKYASEVGSCIKIDNLQDDFDKDLMIDGCNFYDNIATCDTLHLASSKLNVKIANTNFYDNHAYKASGFAVLKGKANVDGVKIYNNKFTAFNFDDNIDVCGGGVFIDCENFSMKNSQIENNETVYGGALGVSSSVPTNKKVIFESVVIKNNKAKYGGAVCVHSSYDNEITFLNCEFIKNQAEIGSSFYTCVFDCEDESSCGGNIKILFSTISNNSANDNTTFDFYNMDNTQGEKGRFIIKASFIIGDDNYMAEIDSYNYYATKSKAIESGSFSADMLESGEHLVATKNSKADKQVPANVYHAWTDFLENYVSNLSIGFNSNFSKLQVNLTASKIMEIFLLICLAIGVVCAVYLIINKLKLALNGNAIATDGVSNKNNTPNNVCQDFDDLNGENAKNQDGEQGGKDN